jgi:glycosyltransferase involved in cell wall biosynthesis
MNILIISHFYPPHNGGVETAAFNLATTYKNKFNHNVVVLTSLLPKTKEYSLEKGVHVYRYHPLYLKLPQKLIPQSNSMGVIMQWKQISNLIKKYKIDTIHCQGRFFPISVITIVLNYLFYRRNIYLSVQGRLLFGLSGIIEDFFDKIFKFFYNKINKIILVSDSLYERFKKNQINENRLKSIPNGVDYELFSQDLPKDYFRTKLKIPQNKKIVLFAGRLDKQKGVEYLLRAIPLVVEKNSNVIFVILGEGTLKEYLEQLSKELNLKNHIIFSNFIPLSNMPAAYNGADIFCLPSIHEGFPLSIAEVLSVGIPIVASIAEGIPEAIHEGENGFLAKPKDVKTLSIKILKALALNDNEIQEMKRKNRLKAKTQYSWRHIAAETLKIYSNSNKK